MTDRGAVPGTLDAAMAKIREDVGRQHGAERLAHVDVDLETVERFSAELPETLDEATRARLIAEAEDLQPWLQGPFYVGGDLVIGGTWRNDHRWAGLASHMPDIAGRRVLDVGSNAGYDPFMFKKLGATHVLACEPYEFVRQARWLEGIYRTGAQIEQLAWEDLHPEAHGRFDLVHCHGVLYHEPHPMLLLERLRDMLEPDGTLLFGSMMLGDAAVSEYLRYVPDAYYGDRTWWFVPGRLAMRWMLETVGFDVEEEFNLSPGPPGEFNVVNGYFKARARAPMLAPITERQGVPVRFPAGVYYSPMPDARELVAEPRRSQIWPGGPIETPGIDWRDEEQVRLAQTVFARQERLELAVDPTGDPTVYHASNDQYPALDAWVLEGLVRHLRPRRMIEVGSGFSSLVTARVNRELLDGSMRFTCIEPYPRDFLIAGVDGITDLRVEKIQDTPVEVFSELGDGDVLFIDTSHTVKTGGDVTWLFHQVLPRLRPGVHVHVHDIFLPCDYPEDWVREGWGWNEQYLVQSFLTFNSGFEIVFGARWMIEHHHDVILEAFPGYADPVHGARGGASLWLRRTGG
jgi:SAM-dependent methyltransferase/predicted O-methyltransferase YrrM